MKIFCPACKTAVPAVDVQLDTGWGKCVACQDVFPLAAQLPGYQPLITTSKVMERPVHSRVVLEEDPHRLLLHMPRQGLRAGTKGTIFFAVIWLSFISFWTMGALGIFFGNGKNNEINWGFAGFSIPFWLVGFGMVYGILWEVSHTRTVCLTPDELTTQVNSWVYARRQTIARARVSLTRHYEVKVKRGEDPPPSFGMEILYEGGSFAFPVDSLEEEQWLIGKVNQFLASHPG